MRVVILSSSLGFGHVRAAEAIEESLQERQPGVTVKHIDFWSLMDRRVAGAVREGYLDLVAQAPEIYDQLHRFNQRQWRDFFRCSEMPPALARIFSRATRHWFPEYRGLPTHGDNLDQTLLLNLLYTFDSAVPAPTNLVRRGLVLWMHRLLVRRLRRRLLRARPDVLCATQMLPASLLAALKRRGDLRTIHSAGVLTDYGVHDFWVGSRMDHYCVATPAMATELRDRGANEASLAVTGIPLMKGFRKPISQSAARARLRIATRKPVVLVTGGGCGIGTTHALRPILEARLDCEVLVAIPDRRVENGALRALIDHHPGRVHLFRDRPDMPTMVRAADVVVGKPGGLSVSEALACGRPFLAVCCLGGQERFNVAYLQQHDVGALVDRTELLQRLRGWLDDSPALARIQRRAWRLGCRDGAERIVDVIVSGQTASKRREAPL